MDDLLLYNDDGCDTNVMVTSYAQASIPTMLIGIGQTIPITCQDKYVGTDAMEMNLPSDLPTGGYYDFIVKFPDWGQKSLVGYQDVRFFVKNVLATPAQLAVKWENAPAEQQSARWPLTIPANQDWTEVVIPLSDFGTFVQQGKMDGFGFSQPDNVVGSALHLYIDDIRVTDGTGQGAIVIPANPGGNPPAEWTSHFLTGSYDNYQDQGYSSRLQGKLDYRYQYLTGSWKTYDNGNFIQDFVDTSKQYGMKSGFVWYQLGKAGEGGTAVQTNLNNTAFMSQYFDDYDLALSQMAAAGSENPMLVIEPDMYGFLLQDTLVPNYDAAQFTVDMTHASALAGKTLPNTLQAYAAYMVQRAKSKVPGAIVGHLLSHWGTLIPGGIGVGSMDAHLVGGAEQARFLNSFGDSGKGDVFFLEKADRDAGTKGPQWFWTQENYDKYFAWVKMISARTGLRACGWQISEGHDSSTPANRDDAVQYFLAHGTDWVQAGFIGILFGPGTDGQADYVNDGGWFLQAMQSYRDALIPLSLSNTVSFKLRYPGRNAPAELRLGTEALIGPAGLYRLDGRKIFAPLPLAVPKQP